jgi:outer membrane protein TolC
MRRGMQRCAPPLVLALLALPSLAFAQATDPLAAELAVPDGLRVADVVRASIATSHEHQAREADVEAARAEVDRVLLALVPRLGLSASYLRLSPIAAPTLGILVAPVDQSQPGPIQPGDPLVGVPIQFPVLLDQTQIRAQLAVPLSDYFLRVLPGRDAAEHAVHAGEASRDATEARLALDAEVVYWGWVRARLARVLALQALAQATAHRDDAARVRAAGLAIDADVARAEAQVAAMEELVATTTTLRDAIADRLRTIMHVDAIPDAIGEALPEDGIAPRDVDRALDRALSRRSELRAIDAQIRALEAQRTITDAALAPRVDLVGEVLLANPNPRFIPAEERFETTWALGVQMSWQLADAVAVEPARRALEARIASARSSRELLAEGLRAELVEANRLLADAESAIHSRRAQVLAAERAHHQVSEVFRVGRGTGLAVVDAQTLLVRARLDLLQARIDLAIATARWRRATED